MTLLETKRQQGFLNRCTATKNTDGIYLIRLTMVAVKEFSNEKMHCFREFSNRPLQKNLVNLSSLNLSSLN